MAKMFTSGFRPKSTTKKAKMLIRNEIKSFYGDDVDNRPYGKDFLMNMKADAESYSAGRNKSDWNKGSELVNGGCFRCYYSDQREFLSKIYGKKNVDNWANDKVHSTYASLIGREYAQMLRESKKKKLR